MFHENKLMIKCTTQSVYAVFHENRLMIKCAGHFSIYRVS